MTARFIARAKNIDETVKNAFDRWYQEEHLVEAHKAIGAQRAWRGWSESARTFTMPCTSSTACGATKSHANARSWTPSRLSVVDTK
jgi:hypothetical protein